MMLLGCINSPEESSQATHSFLNTKRLESMILTSSIADGCAYQDSNAMMRENQVA